MAKRLTDQPDVFFTMETMLLERIRFFTDKTHSQEPIEVHDADRSPMNQKRTRFTR